jgi:iron(III) transport system permease protein
VATVTQAAPRSTLGLPRGISRGQLLVFALAAVLALLVLYPLAFLFAASFAPATGSADQGFSLEGYRRALTDVQARNAVITTLWLSLVRAVAAVALAVFLAWAIVRTNVPGARIFHGLLLVSFFLPNLPQVLAWTFLLSPRTGSLNVALRALVGSDATSGPFNIYSYEGIVFIGVLTWSGFLYLFIAPAFRAVDASLEEAARMSGASGFRTALRISIPLLAPAIIGAFGLAFIRFVESFETELLLGTPAQIYVFTTQIYAYIARELTPQYPPAIALSTIFVGLVLVLVLLQRRVLGGRSFVTISGKDQRRAPADLGRWKWALFAVLVAFNVIHLVLPLGMLVLGSVQRSIVQFRLDGFTFDHWKILLGSDMGKAVQNTLIVGIAAAVIAIALVSIVSYVVTRTAFRGRQTLEILTWVPYMVPSFVLGVGFLWAALKGNPLPWVLYGTHAVLVIALVVRFIPLGSRLMNGTMVQLAKELEEASRMSGATFTRTFRRIVLPLLSPAIGIGILMFIVIAIRDLSTVILLYGPSSTLLSVVFYANWRSGTQEDAAVIGLLMAVIGLAVAMGIVVLQRLGRGRAEAPVL